MTDRALQKKTHVLLTEVGGSATCSAMRISATCATRKISADVRFDPQSADCGIAHAHQEIKLRTLLPLCTIEKIERDKKSCPLSNI